MHSTHLIYGYMVSDHSDSKRENNMGNSFQLVARVILYAHTMSFVTPVMEHWLEYQKVYLKNTSTGNKHKNLYKN